MSTRFTAVRLLLALLVLCVVGRAASAAQEDAARIYGTVVDRFNGMTLPTAAVAVVGTDIEVFTDLDGRYEIRLPAGTYELRSSFPGYEDEIVQVQLTAGGVMELDIVALGLVRFRDEVTVVGESGDTALDTQEAQLVERRRASVIQDNVSSQEMKANADSTAAAAMQRVTGLSVVDNQYVFVRGLGERYSSTTLGGAVLPTTEPDRKVVPLDLFPAGLLDSVQVVKSDSPDRPGEFAGGVVQIHSLRFPDRRTLDVGLKQGWNELTSGGAVADYPGGGTDWLGFDDGTRGLPASIPGEKLVRAGRFSTVGFSPEELQAFGRAFANVWEPRRSDARHNQGYSTTFGGVWEDVGLVTSLSYASTSQFQEEEQNFFRIGGSDADVVEVQNAYDFATTTTRTTLGAIGNASYRLTPNHQLRLESFWTNTGRKETRVFEGFNADMATEIRNQRLLWAEDGVLSTRVAGEHLVAGLAGARIEWRYARSEATHSEPDLREVMYKLNRFSSRYLLADESQSGFRMFNELEDIVHDASVDVSVFFTQWGGLPALVKFGPAVVDRSRDFASRRFRFTHQNTIGFDLSQPPEALFAAANIGPVFELREETRATDAYTGAQTISAGYGMIDLPLAGRFRVLGGARVERSEQSVDTFDPFNPDAGGLRSRLDDTDVLPSLNAVYRMSDTMNLRVGYSHTVNRPEFRELAPFEFTDVVGGRAVVGNPELRRALIRNVDLRWEWFPAASEVVAASIFYKDFEDPIERVVQATAQLRTSNENALGATNAGVELEARRELLPGVFTGVNFTFVDSSIELERGESQVQTSLDRPLSGLSRTVFNAIVETRVPTIDAIVRLLYNYYGDRITDVGSLGLPDIVEQGRPSLDLVFSWTLTPQASLRLTFDNLTDSDYRFEQGGEVQRLFRLGRTLGFSLDYHVW